MKNLFKKTALATALAATTLASATPAMARDRYYDRDNGNTAGAAIVGGVIGLALGAVIASGANRNDRYRDDRYYRDGRYYGRDGGYYDRDSRYYGQDNRYRDYRDRGGYDRRGYRGY